MDPFVARARHLADLIAAARSRRGFLAALADFEGMLTVTLDYPRGCFNENDVDALSAVADAVVEQIERRVGAHADRPAVEQQLVAAIYRIRREVEAVYTRVRYDPAGNATRNAGRTAVVSPSR